MARAGRALPLRGALRGRAVAGPAQISDTVLPVGRAPGERVVRRARRRRHADPRRARKRRPGPRVPQRVPAPRHPGRGGLGLREGVRLPLSRLDLRPRRRAATRAARARVPGSRQGDARTRPGRDGRATRPRVRHAGCAAPAGHRPRRPARAARAGPPAARLERDRRAGQLEDRRRGLPRGLSHPLDAPGDVLPRPVRQPERRRDVRAQQPHRVPVPAHQQAARRPAGRALRGRRADVRLPPVPQRHGRDLPDQRRDGRARAAGHRSHQDPHLRAERSPRRRRRRTRGALGRAGLRAGRRGGGPGRGVLHPAGLASGANEFFEFGRFEGAIVHFHRGLHEALDGVRAGVALAAARSA